jgi:hypothetical protein
VTFFNKNELDLILERLNAVKLELFRLRAMLLPTEEATDEEIKSIQAAREEIEVGQSINIKCVFSLPLTMQRLNFQT